MNRIKTYPLFTTLVVLAILGILGEGWFLYRWNGRVSDLGRRLEARIAQIERLQRQKPGPTDDNLAAAREDLSRHASVLSIMLRTLNVVGPDEVEYFKGAPKDRLDSFFDIASFVDRSRRQAAEAGVALPADERFGFSAYAEHGPEPELIETVYRQRRVVELLLGKLFSARPKALISVQREDPAAMVQSGDGNPARSSRSGASATSGDFFVIDPQVSARAPGYVDTMAFRITFTGQTAALRGFMNALATPDIPLVVRSVEVETVGSESDRAASASRGSSRGRAASADSDESKTTTVVPIVSENTARFTVTIELFEVKIRPPAVETAAL